MYFPLFRSPLQGVRGRLVTALLFSFSAKDRRADSIPLQPRSLWAISISLLKNKIEKLIINAWQDYWDNSTKGRDTYLVLNKVNHAREMQQLLFQIRMIQ